MPYRDFFMEYPPGALAVFLPPAAFGDHYNAGFKVLMALCGAGMLVVVALLLARLGATAVRLWAALLLLALSPIALGPISLNTYDAWPALLTVTALLTLPVVGCGLLGLAFAAKVYPIVLLPLALVYAARRYGRGMALRCAAAFGAVAAVAIVPFLALAPHGVWESYRAQAARGLQDESLGGSLLGVADRLGWYTATVARRAGEAVSFEYVGSLPRVLAVVSSVAQVAAVLIVLWLYLRGRDNLWRLTLGFAASIAGFLAFARFFSPQYMVWLIPFVVLLGPLEWALTGAALLLAQVWFFHYHDIHAVGGYVWLVFVRDLVVIALFVVLCRRAAEDEDSVLLEHELPVRVPS